MFSRRLDQLLLSLNQPGAFRFFPAAQARGAWNAVERRFSASLSLRAEQAKNQPIPQLFYGDLAGLYQDGAAVYARDQRIRREITKALVLGHAARGEGYIARIADLIWAICEETTWAAPETYRQSGFLIDHMLDESAAETAEILALCCHVLEDKRLEPVRARAQAEIRRRALRPLLDGGNWPFLRRPEGAMQPLLCLLTAALLTPGDDHERWLCVRRVLLLLDDALASLPENGGFADSLQAHIARTEALALCLDLIATASGGEVDLRDERLFLNMARLPCPLHIGAGWFLNPGGGMRPEIAPSALYTIAQSARDQQLAGLAAFLNRRATYPQRPFDEKSPPLIAQMNAALLSLSLESAPARAALYPSIELEDMRIIARRQNALYAALCGGENRAADGPENAGDFILFCGNEPVLVDAGAFLKAEMHNLPTFGGKGQAYGHGRRGEDIEQNNELYAMLSMNLQPAYPESTRLSTYQRSVLFMPFDGSVRLMDAFEFDRTKARVDFHFISPCEIANSDGFAQIGPVLMEWEQGFAARVEKYPMDASLGAAWPCVYRLTLSTIESALGGSYTFIFRETPRN